MADLAALAFSSDPVEMQILHPTTNEVLTTDSGEEMALLLVGLDSDECRKADREITNRRLRNQTMGSRKVKISAEEIESESFDKTCACVVGFKNVVVNGVEIEFSKKNVKDLFTTLPWLKRQAEDFIYDQSNFIKQ
jgi:hypothetical protein